MFALKVITFLALAYSVYGDESLLKCLQKAVLNGVPDADIPNHEPLLVPQNISIDRTIGLWEVEGDVKNIIWYNIPWWNVTEFTLASDDGITQVFKWGLYWDYFNITADYDVILNGLILHYELDGEIIITMKDVQWTGTYNFTVGTDSVNETVNDITIDWQNGDLTVDITHLELLEKLLDLSFEESIKALIALSDTLNIFGQAFKSQINNKWLANPDRIATMISWCANSTQKH